VLAGPLTRFTAALADAPSSDRILGAGRSAWERTARFYRAFSAFPRSGCGLYRAWARTGFRPSARPRVIDAIGRAFAALGDESEIDATTSRAGVRMVQLGAPSKGARAFAANVFGGGGGADPFFGVRDGLR
jgi:hypothetical protein